METAIRKFNQATIEFLKALDENIEGSKRILVSDQVRAFNSAQANMVFAVCALFDIEPLTTVYTEEEIQENLRKLKDLTGIDFDPNTEN